MPPLAFRPWFLRPVGSKRQSRADTGSVGDDDGRSVPSLSLADSPDFIEFRSVLLTMIGLVGLIFSDIFVAYGGYSRPKKVYSESNVPFPAYWYLGQIKSGSRLYFQVFVDNVDR